MTKTKIQSQDFETVSKLKVWFGSASIVCIFAYVIMLGLTAADVVTLRSVSKAVEDKKTELSMAELGYMNASNTIALETMPDTGFHQASNIAYVSASGTNTNSVAIAGPNSKRD